MALHGSMLTASTAPSGAAGGDLTGTYPNPTLAAGFTGTGAIVKETSPTLVTPTLGVASATTVNKVALTAPATGSTLTIADGKTLTASNTMTLSATDGDAVVLSGGVAAVTTYTPTLGATTNTNVTASTPQVTNYKRIGDFVQVWGFASITPTATPTIVVLSMTLPIATNLGLAQDLVGQVHRLNTIESGIVVGDTANDVANFRILPTLLTNGSWYFSFCYRII